MASAEEFRHLHHTGQLLVMPNAWDPGSARILEHLGFSAIATTSSGAAAAQARSDGNLGRDAALRHSAELAAAVEIPVSADLENCFADEPAGVAQTIQRALGAGLAGASVEDWSGNEIYERGLAVERVRAAVEAAGGGLVITARAENHIHGVDDLDDTLARLQAYAEAGADVVFAPGVRTEDQIRAVVEAVGVPVSVLAVPGVPPVGRLTELGVRRLSVGGAFAFAAYGTVVEAAQELKQAGTYNYFEASARGGQAAREAFG